MNKEIIDGLGRFIENGLSYFKEAILKKQVLSSQPLTVTPQGLHSKHSGLMREYGVDHMRESRSQDFDPLEAAVLINTEQLVLEAPGRQVAYIMTCAPHKDVRFIVTMTRSSEEPDLVYLKSYRLSKDLNPEKADSLLGLLAEKADGREIKEVTAEDGQKALILVVKNEESFITELSEIREAEIRQLKPLVPEVFQPRLEFWPKLELMNRVREIEPGLILESGISRPLFRSEPQREEAFQSAAQSVVIESPAKVVPEQKPVKVEVEEGLKPEEKSPPMPLAVVTSARPRLQLAIRPVIQPSLECQIQAAIQPVFFKEKALVLKLQPQSELAVVKQQQFQIERQALQLWLSAEQRKEKAMEKAVARSALRPTAKPTKVEPLPIIIERARKMRKQITAEPLISVKTLATEAEQPQKSLVVKLERKQEPEELVIVESVPVVFDWQSPLFRVRARKEQRLPDFKTKEFLTPISFRKDWIWSVKGFEKREDMFLTNLLLHSLTPPVKVLIQAADLSTSLPANQVIFDRQWLETEMIIPVQNTKIIKADEYPEELTVEAGFLELVEKLLYCDFSLSEFSFCSAELYD